MSAPGSVGVTINCNTNCSRCLPRICNLGCGRKEESSFEDHLEEEVEKRVKRAVKDILTSEEYSYSEEEEEMQESVEPKKIRACVIL